MGGSLNSINAVNDVIGLPFDVFDRFSGQSLEFYRVLQNGIKLCHIFFFVYKDEGGRFVSPPYDNILMVAKVLGSLPLSRSEDVAAVGTSIMMGLSQQQRLQFIRGGNCPPVLQRKYVLEERLNLDPLVHIFGLLYHMAVQPELKELVLLGSRSVVGKVDVGALPLRDLEESTHTMY